MILGLRILYIKVDVAPSMPLKAVYKRIGCAAERMRAERTGVLLISKKFPYRELVSREGFVEADECRLTALLAGKIVSKFAGRDKVAAFFARRLTSEAERVFREMCRDFKYVMAAVESDCGVLFNALGRRLGISVIGQPTAQQLSKADVAVFFDPPARPVILPEKCVAIPACAAALQGVVCRKAVDGLTIELGDDVLSAIPDGFAQEPLIAAALEAGTLRRQDVLVRDLKIRDIYA
jgi:hypothetical protein